MGSYKAAQGILAKSEGVDGGMGFYRWSASQLVPIVVSYFVAAMVSGLPPIASEIARVMLPGWATSYSLSTLVFGWYVVDSYGRVHTAWNGRYVSGLTGNGIKAFQLMVSVASAAAGYVMILNQTIMAIGSLQALLVSGGLGGFWGYVSGVIANRNTIGGFSW